MYEPEVDLGGDVTSTAGTGLGNIPYVGLATKAYDIYKNPMQGLMSPSTPMLAAKSIGAMTGGLAAGAGSAMTGMGAVLAAAIIGSQLMSAKKQKKISEQMVDNPFIDKGNGWESGTPPAAWGLMNGSAMPGYGEYDYSKIPTGTQMARKFKSVFGSDAPTSEKMKNWESRAYAKWMGQQPEVQAAEREYNKWLGENYEYITHAGDEGMNPYWEKRSDYEYVTTPEQWGGEEGYRPASQMKRKKGLMGNYDSTIG